LLLKVSPHLPEWTNLQDARTLKGSNVQQSSTQNIHALCGLNAGMRGTESVRRVVALDSNPGFSAGRSLLRRLGPPCQNFELMPLIGILPYDS
jgi:hypothetical protein